MLAETILITFAAIYLMIGIAIYLTMPKDKLMSRPLADVVLILLCAVWPLTVILAFRKQSRDLQNATRREDTPENPVGS